MLEQLRRALARDTPAFSGAIPKERVERVHKYLLVLVEENRQRAAASEPNSEAWLVSVAKADAHDLAVFMLARVLDS